jgi:hypothetical protein
MKNWAKKDDYVWRRGWSFWEVTLIAQRIAPVYYTRFLLRQPATGQRSVLNVLWLPDFAV